MDNELVCNFRKCRKRLNAGAWVTSCSHIFCEDDAARECNKGICPACQTALPGKYDLIKVDLQLPEQHKSICLAGQKPEVIMECCTRALAFWTYQAHQERVYQEYVATKAKERNTHLEKYYEQTISNLEAEISSIKSQFATLKIELESTRRKYNEVSEKLTEKSRQYQKLQGLYDGLRRRCITPQSFEGEREGVPYVAPRFIQSHHDVRQVISQDDMVLSHKNHLPSFGDHRMDLERSHLTRPSPRSCSPPQKESSKDFVLRPNVTPIPTAYSVVQDRDRFNIGLCQALGQSAHKKH